MEELKKENKFLKVLALILCFLVGFGVGYYLTSNINKEAKVEEKETPKEEPDNNEKREEETTPTVVSTINSVDDYPTSSDNTATSFGEIIDNLDEKTMLTNFKDVNKTIKSSTFNYDCEEYGEVMIDYTTEEIMGNACKKLSVTVDNKLTIESLSGYERSRGCGITQELYKTDKYYIFVATERCGKTSTIDIYNNKGTLIKQLGVSNGYYSRTITNWYFSNRDNFEGIETPISFVNNNLYYIFINGRPNDDDRVNLEMRSIDLTKDTIEEKIIDSFQGCVSEK